MSLLDRINDANRLDPTDLVPFEVDGNRVGLALPRNVGRRPMHRFIHRLGASIGHRQSQ